MMVSPDPRASSEPPSVAIVVPIYRARLDEDERLSLRHLEAFLSHYPRYALVPRSLDLRALGEPAANYERIAFDDACFKSVTAYSRLLLTADFYRAFAAHRHLLIYQLDSLALGDELPSWCRAGYDYVGAPWLIDPERPARGFSRVGNGGFSLRSVAGALEVLEAPAPGPRQRALVAWRVLVRRWPELAAATPRERWRMRWRLLRDTRRGGAWYAARYTLNEDRFWSDRASLFRPTFAIPSPRQALRFAFECAPRYCFERNGHEWPFGGHAWARFDRAFWQPRLLA